MTNAELIAEAKRLHAERTGDKLYTHWDFHKVEVCGPAFHTKYIDDDERCAEEATRKAKAVVEYFSRCAELAPLLADALASALGQVERMRERCAEQAESFQTTDGGDPSTFADGACIAAAIRALPLTPPDSAQPGLTGDQR